MRAGVLVLQQLQEMKETCKEVMLVLYQSNPCKLAPNTPAPSGKVTRLLAANGQPRKVPTALFGSPASQDTIE